jgi:hypothetical protein
MDSLLQLCIRQILTGIGTPDGIERAGVEREIDDRAKLELDRTRRVPSG